MKRFLTVIVCVGLVSASFIFTSPVHGYYTGMSASVVVGEPNFTTNGSSCTTNTFSTNYGVTTDGNQKLIVANYGCDKLIIFNNIPTTNGAPNSFTVGSGSGTPSRSTFDVVAQPFVFNSKLFVADIFNNRVLIFNQVPTTSSTLPDTVVGQPDFVTSVGGFTSNTLNRPYGAFVDSSGKLYITDSSANRIMIWNQIPTTNGVAADLVLGQADFTQGNSNRGGSATANTLNLPKGKPLVVGNKLLVSDTSNNRVLIWNSLPTTNGQSADLVIGQADFTHTSANQGSSIGSNTLNTPTDLTSDGKRLFIADDGNNRILIFNKIPTSNNTSADVVIGQTNFSANLTGQLNSTGFAAPSAIFVSNNQLFVSDETNQRVLIFNNVIATPEISFGGVEKLSFGRVRIKGSVKMGEAGHYDLGGGGGVSFSVNGVDGAGINSVGNQNSDGGGNLLYDFSNDFEPWTGGNGNKDDWINNFDFVRGSRGFTVKVTSRNSNTDSSRIFYFEPFKITSFSPSVTRFSVNKYQVQTIKDNIDHFEIWVRPTFNPTSTSSASTGSFLPSSSFSSWTKYLDTISTDKLDITSGEAVVSTTSLTQTPLISLLKGKYDVKVVAVSKDSNFRQDSQNTISVNLTSSVPLVSYINPNNLQVTTNQWFPLQLEKALGTNMGIISSFNLGSVSTFPYISQDLTLRLSGTSTSNSTVAVRVTDTVSGDHKDYLTTTNKDSSFTIFHALYPTSILTISTFDTNGHFNLLPPIPVTRE